MVKRNTKHVDVRQVCYTAKKTILTNELRNYSPFVSNLSLPLTNFALQAVPERA